MTCHLMCHIRDVCLHHHMTAIHPTVKPHHQMTIDEATAVFELPDLHPAIHNYLDCCANGVEYTIVG